MPSILVHTLLSSRGGTTGIARAVHGAADAYFSCEMEDGPLLDGDRLVQPRQVGALATEIGVDLVHIHATQDWAATLESVGEAGLKCIVTLHDCRALTGGCPYPLSCEEWRNQCIPDCPRGFAQADEVCAKRREVINAVAPVFVAPSRWMAKMAKEALPGHDIRVLPNGVPWPERQPNKMAARQALGLGPQARVMLYVAHGGLEAEYKRGSMIPSMFANIKSSVPQAVGLVVGGDVQGRDGDLLLCPYVDASTLATFMAASDVLAYPTQADNHPLVVLEAMSQGLPVVAYASGGVPEQITSSAVGVLIESLQMADITHAVIELLQNAKKADSIGAAAFEYGRVRFSQQRMIQDYLKLYQRLLP